MELNKPSFKYNVFTGVMHFFFVIYEISAICMH